VGSYWDRKGEREIDLIAVNELDKEAVVAEVKRSPEKISLKRLEAKATVLEAELKSYGLQFKALSLADM
jgi:hypothetical protein